MPHSRSFRPARLLDIGLSIAAVSSLRVNLGARHLSRLRAQNVNGQPGSSWSHGRNSGATNNKPSLFVLLPAYNAEGEVLAAYDYFSRHFGNEPGVIFLLVTTEREAASRTPAVASKLADSTENWYWLHSSRRPFCKASQLNDAVDWIRTVWGRGARYVVYDIDGRPECLPLLPVGGCFADIEQQVPLPTRAPADAPSMIGRGHAAVQCVRVFGQEVFTWASAQERCPGGALQLPAWSFAKYCWGNGLVISDHALERIGGFPIPVDDIEVGYEGLIQGLSVRIRGELVHHAAYVSPRDMVRSLGFVIGGDRPLGHDRLSRASRWQAARLVAADIRNRVLLAEPIVWSCLIIWTRFRPAAVIGVFARYSLPALAARHHLAAILRDMPGREELTAPNVGEVAVASLATPLIRAFSAVMAKRKGTE